MLILPKEEYKTSIFGITNTFVENLSNGYNHSKLIDNSTLYYKEFKNNEYTILKLSDFDIDINYLIGGDALKVTHNSKSEILFRDIFPSICYIDGNIRKIEVVYTKIYEVILHKNDDGIWFEYVDDLVNCEISLPRFGDDYCISNYNGQLIKRNFDMYLDGTKMYYAYNPSFANPLDYTCMYDFIPR